VLEGVSVRLGVTHMWSVLLVSIISAWGGYGDPIDGHPNPDERAMHLWTNAVRVDPEAFSSYYPCNFDNFQSTEQTPKRPLRWHLGLNEAARFHSQDMYEHNWFSHTSFDGTSFYGRVARFYSSDWVGENIAYGHHSMFGVVVEGWMCSSGHRSNIMDDDWEELGTGVVGLYHTQDFGAQSAITEPLIHMGSHSPDSPIDDVTFWADYYEANGEVPEIFKVVVNGNTHDMKLEYGSPAQGVYAADVSLDSIGCHKYYFLVRLENDVYGVFPEEGAYGFGACEYDDPEAKWMPRSSADEAAMHDRECGCQTTQRPLSGLLVSLMPCVLLIFARRERWPSQNKLH
jgi:hypothetical protein